MGLFSRRQATAGVNGPEHDGMGATAGNNVEKKHHRGQLPRFNHNGHKVTKGITPEGESGRSWFHPWLFLKICFRSASRVSMAV